jgi:hypothetical protein
MAARAETTQPAVDVSEDIRAMPRVVIDAFFDASALSLWWPATRSVTTPRPLGPYAIEWMTETRDEVLGRFGGVFRGTVMHIESTRGFFVADVFWLPPNGTPIGPMALEIACRLGVTPDGLPCTKVRVTQGGFEESTRWRRYYEVAQAEWQRQLESLKRHLEWSA